MLVLFMVTVHLPASAEESAISLLTQLDAQYDRAWNTLDAHLEPPAQTRIRGTHICHLR